MHSLPYFDRIETSVRKSYELLKEGGMQFIAIAPRNLVTEPYQQAYNRLYKTSPWFGEDVRKILSECNFPFRQDQIEFSVNMTESFQKGSPLGKPLLDFMIGANTAYFSPSQSQLLLDYFNRIAQRTDEGEIILKHWVDLFYLKWSNSTPVTD